MCVVWISHSSHENGISVIAITSTKSNLCLLIDVEMLLGLNVIMPLLEAVFFFNQICATTRCVYVWFYCSGQDLWWGCISDILWQTNHQLGLGSSKANQSVRH